MQNISRKRLHLKGKTMSFTKTGPNKALHLTASSVRSCVAPASGSR